MTHQTMTLARAKLARGRIDLTFEEYDRLVQQATASGCPSIVRGWSPGPVADILGITRQGVHNAIKRGTLTAFYVRQTGWKDASAIVVTDASLARYRERNRVSA